MRIRDSKGTRPFSLFSRIKMAGDQIEPHDLQERRELVQDVIDRLLSNPAYKAALVRLNARYLPNKDYNRRLQSYRDPAPPEDTESLNTEE